MERNIWPAPGVPRRRKVIGIGFAIDFKDGNGNALRERGFTGEPVRIRPRLQDSGRIIVPGCFFDDIVERVKQ